MADQTSKSVSEFESYLDRANGVDEKRESHCEKHGEFTDVHYSGKGNIKTAYWAGCPQCQKDRWDREVKDQARKEQAEREARRVERLMENSGIPARFAGKGFDNYQVVNEKAGKHLAKIRDYAELVSSSDHGGRSLLLLGKVGNGKTHLGCALLAEVIKATGHRCRYWTFSELVRAVKASFTKGSNVSEQDVYNEFAATRLVVLDEVGMQNFTDFEQAVAYEAINARYLAQLPTVLISNLQASDLPLSVGERVVDRLREGGGRALDFDWQSFRLGGAA